MNETDLQLLSRYATEHAEEAFAELVQRRLGLVYSAALRQVRAPQLAEEVAQSVFTDLARSAHRLPPKTVVIAWLYEVTRRTAIDVVRREARRKLREQVASEMHAMNATVVDWTHIEPLLDEAMYALDHADRTAVLLRYFENKSLREVGEALGTSDDAAQKRVSRALERLRQFFMKRGVAVSTGGLVVAISSNAVQVAPVALAGVITAAAIAGGTVVSGVGAGTGWLSVVAGIARRKIVVGGVGVVFVVATLITWRVSQPGQVAGPETAQTPAAAQPQNQQAIVSEDVVVDTQREPDPLELLRGIVRARQAVASGSMDLQLSSDIVNKGRSETRKNRFNITWEGSKLRFETWNREYAYTVLAGDDTPEGAEKIRQADSMDKEEAVRAGLLKGMDAHQVAISDGTTYMRWRDTGTIIDDLSGPNKSASHFFDPRFLGVRASIYSGAPLENYLGYKEAKSILLAGKETLDGIPAWHVRVLTKYDDTLDYWVDAARPYRLLKETEPNGYAISKYDNTARRDPIPCAVIAHETLPRNNFSFVNHFTRSNAHFNVSLDSTTFSLAGLDMPIGTPVVDLRIQRRIGYWTGVGLSDNLPSKKDIPIQPVPKMADLLSQLEADPASPEGLNTAAWILLNTHDGPEVEKAADVILREHTRDTNLVYLCTDLGRMRHRCVKPLLERIIKDNPSIHVRGTACLTLATLLKDEAKYGANKKTTEEAVKLYERIISEFGVVKQRGFRLPELAKPELFDLKYLSIGNPAPDAEGVDLNGENMSLADYRGKVVLLVFWTPGYLQAPEHRRLFQKLAGKPFAWVGVYCDNNLAKAHAEMEQQRITWPSFADKRSGPIAEAWHVHSWADIWVLDKKGVIRGRELYGQELVTLVEKLVDE